MHRRWPEDVRRTPIQLAERQQEAMRETAGGSNGSADLRTLQVSSGEFIRRPLETVGES
jgi:hypothetical protein